MHRSCGLGSHWAMLGVAPAPERLWRRWDASCGLRCNDARTDPEPPYDVFVLQQLAANHIDILPIQVVHLAVVATLPMHYRDPFDRLLAAQAVVERVPVVSADLALDAYPVQHVW